ncbi:MAG: hypothetical protein AAB152_12485 [Candidatus Coatesbacteria bacterium]
MKDMGVEVRVATPPLAAMVYLSQEASERLKNSVDELGIISIDRERIPEKRLKKLAGDAAQIAGAWNRILDARRLDEHGGRGRPIAKLYPDAFVPPPSTLSFSRTIPVHSPPWGSQWPDTSEYLLADPRKPISVMVALILPESNGNAEDWTMTGTIFTDGWTVYEEVEDGLDFWARNAPACAPLTFGLTTPRSATTSVEPISLRATGPAGGCLGQEDLWIGEIISQICPGCPGPSYMDKVRQYDDAWRLTVDSDWAYTIFVVNSHNDPDNSFAPLPAGPPCNSAALFAYAYLGGPFLVMTWGNDGYGITWMDAVVAHETGHIFYALDEYCSASSPAETSGYLNVANGNHQLAFPGVCPTDYSCPANPPTYGVCCIMRGQTDSFTSNGICDFTLGQIGWRDADSDSIMDILNKPPDAHFTFTDPSVIDGSVRPALVRQTARITGVATCGTIYNDNPYPGGSHPLGLRDNMTVSRVVDVTYSVDGGPILPAFASDGFFSSGQEAFYFDIAFPAPGTPYVLEVRAGCNAGCQGATIYGSSVSASVYTLPMPAACP